MRRIIIIAVIVISATPVLMMLDGTFLSLACPNNDKYRAGIALTSEQAHDFDANLIEVSPSEQVAQQQPKPIADVKPAPEVELVPAPPTIATEISEAIRSEEEARQTYLAAAQRTATVLYKALSEVGIKASECAGLGQNGRPNPFACWKVDPQTGASSFEKVKVKK